ncbi:MAG TPA: phospholipase C, phosphocholine-specific, partial [Chryseolinea sp.]
MDSRREFLKKAALLSGSAGLAGFIPSSIERAFSIDPAQGSTYLDAEHVVILMQENRSFDHCYGSLQGVRGFNDPRAMLLPSKNSAFLQTNAKGETYVPFRLNIKDTNATWMGSLPHGWTDQTDVRNNGRCDQWLEAKRSGHKDYQDMPLTLGFYNREDLPFYYALADAFTICDQNFCSSLTGTTPNRLYLWTGKIREDANAQARVRNEETDYCCEAQWKTFPERLEENNISWRIYQNEVSVGVGLEGEAEAWLANFTDNPIEWFSQFQVRYARGHVQALPKEIEVMRSRIREAEAKLATLQKASEEYLQLKGRIEKGKQALEQSIQALEKYTPENYAKLSQREKALHEKAFCTNANDPHYHELTSLQYNDGSIAREMKIPKGDVLHQFRSDVKNGKLPTVSWLVAPENFSDHPGAPWYGAWYLSEAMDILTKNPDVWSKTIFILCYDENDGYFDHVPPFVPPVPDKQGTGLVSANIDLHTEYVSLEKDLQRKPAKYARGGPIGLGYRVPLVIASPWSRGGAVCSQVFDHTSVLQFLEKFLSHKTGRKIEESNISDWRRAVCGDLTAAFKPYIGEKISLPKSISRNEFVEAIHKAQFKKTPSGFHALTKAEIDRAKIQPSDSVLPRQEKGTRPSRALPYELYVDGNLSADARSFQIQFAAANNIFGRRSAGAPFHVFGYAGDFSHRSYALNAGDSLKDTWDKSEFANGGYHFEVHGPNGFFRKFTGTINDPN